MQRNLQCDPVWQGGELGHPLPDSVHACSVAMPTWPQVIGYEEGDPDIMARLKCGYPRFYCNRLVQALFHEALAESGKAGEAAVVFPIEETAQRCADWLHARTQCSTRLSTMVGSGVVGVLFPEEFLKEAMLFWRYSGEIISSRQAENALGGRKVTHDGPEGIAARQQIKAQLAASLNVDRDDVYLFPSGMGAVYTAHRMLTALRPNARTVQLEFPYVDALRVQREFGSGVWFLPVCGDVEYAEMEKQFAEESFAGVFCEMVSNPLMRSVDLSRLRPLLQRHGIPLAVEDTLATGVNIDPMRAADVVSTSLTKFFSGEGDVMGGALTLNPASPFYATFKEFLRDDIALELADEDAVVLARNAEDYGSRVRQINGTAAEVVAFLENHPKVAQVMYPSLQQKELYDQWRREDGGYGGLVSFLLKNEAATPDVYDRISICKGPSLGTNFSLLCPYVLLAHYDELEWAEELGASRNLLRMSVGLESAKDLIARLEAGLALA